MLNNGGRYCAKSTDEQLHIANQIGSDNAHKCARFMRKSGDAQGAALSPPCMALLTIT